MALERKSNSTLILYLVMSVVGVALAAWWLSAIPSHPDKDIFHIGVQVEKLTALAQVKFSDWTLMTVGAVVGTTFEFLMKQLMFAVAMFGWLPLGFVSAVFAIGAGTTLAGRRAAKRTA